MPRRAAGTPILPILTYSDLSEVVNLIKRRARSLAGYIFGTGRRLNTSFTVCRSAGVP
jgi:acyl-CoA reductase-like NAD-dependent aldehyde dehydrogenase